MTDTSDRDPTLEPFELDVDDWESPADRPAAPQTHASTRGSASAVREPRAVADGGDWLDSLLDAGSVDVRRPERNIDVGRVGVGEPGLESTSRATYDAASDAGAGSDDAADMERCESGLCTFWIGSRCFALDIGLVGEVVHVDRVVEVPLTPPALLGLFNLRGTPVALVNLATVLQLAETARPEGDAEAGALLALVLRFSGITVGAVIDKMQAVVAPGRARLIRADASDNPLVRGFLANHGPSREAVTVLDASVLVSRFTSMKFVTRN